MSVTLQGKIEDRDIWNDLVGDKDTLSLREMGEKYGVTPSAIAAAFKRLGIRRRPAPSGPRNRGEDVAEAATEIAAEASASRPRPSARPGSKDSRILKHWDDLGKLPDTEIARRAKVPTRTIARFRELHGIAARPATPVGARPERTPGAAAADASGGETPSVRRAREIQAALTPYDSLIGQLPDSVVAEVAGLPLQSVRHERQKRGILAAGKMPRNEIASVLDANGIEGVALSDLEDHAEVPAAKVAPAAPTADARRAEAPRASVLRAESAAAARASDKRAELHAWRVTFQRGATSTTRVVVAGSFVDAASLADRWAGNAGAIVLVEALGPALG